MKNLLKAAIISVGLLISTSTLATDYPSKDIRIIVPFGAGGGTDSVAKALASNTKAILGKNIRIINRTGGAGSIGMSYGAKMRPDGYTLTVVTREIASLPQMGLMQHTVEDFKLIRMVNLDPALIIVSADSPFNSVKDLVEAAKKNPGAIQFASTAAPNFYLMALEKNQGIKLDAIPHNGAAEAIPSIIEHDTQVTMITPGEALPQIRKGRLKVLGVMSEQRIAYLPDVPTLKEQGFNITSATWRGIGAPKDTPEAVIKILGEAFDKAMASPEFKKVMADGAMTPYPLKEKEFTDFVKEDIKKLSILIN
nr:hypothetical protein BCCFPMHH_00029 [uncultured bacterium]